MASEPVRAPPLVPTEAPPPANEALARDLAGLVGWEAVSTEAADRRRAAGDMWPKTFLWERQGLSPSPPDVVVRPGTVEGIAAVVRFAAQRGIPITPHGAGSGVCGGAIPVRGGITMRFDRLDRILAIDREGLTAEVQAGVLGLRLEQALQERSLTLGHFPSSIGCSSVGGWLATRSGGQSSSRYGKIEDMVRSMRCVLGSGEVVEFRRPADGIDWMDLMLGSEGAFGVIAEATFRLWPAPEVVLPRGFRFPSLRAGLGAVEALLRAGLRPSVVRLYDPLSAAVALRSPGESEEDTDPPGLEELRPRFRSTADRFGAAIADGGSGLIERLAREGLHLAAGKGLNLALARPGWIGRGSSLLRRSLLVLVHQGAYGEAEPEAADARAICARHGGRDLGEAPGRRWLRKRWDVSHGLRRIFESSGWVDTFEVAAPWGKVEAVHDAVRAAVSPHALVMAHFSHAYPDGCSIYFTFTGAAPTPEQGLASYDAAWSAAIGAAMTEGATISHHHGVGLLKERGLRDELGEGGMELVQRIERSWDPKGILNPGKLGLDLDGSPGGATQAASQEGPGGATRAASQEGPGGATRAASQERPGGARPLVLREEGARERHAFHLDRSRLTSIDPVDERAMWVRAFAGASVATIEATLRARGLTLGSQPSSVFRGTLGDWLEGPFAGRRVEGGRLASGVASVEALLSDGLLFVSHAAPRSAAGPAVAQLLLGGEGRFGQLVAATVKAEPASRTVELAFAGGADRLRAWLLACVRDPIPPLAIRIECGPPLAASLVLPTGTLLFEARVGRAVAAARALGLSERSAPGVRAEHVVAGRERSTEAWLALLPDLSEGEAVRVVRIARESAVVT